MSDTVTASNGVQLPLNDLEQTFTYDTTFVATISVMYRGIPGQSGLVQYIQTFTNDGTDITGILTLGCTIMINGGDFLKWLEIFGIPLGGGGGGGGVTKAEVQQFAFNSGLAIGTDDAFVVNLSPPVTSLTNNLIVAMSSGSLQNLTRTPTLKINALAPVPIVLWSGQPAPGDIETDTAYLFIYNEALASFELINPSISTADTFAVQSNFYNAAIDFGSVNAYQVSLNPTPLSSFNIGFPLYVQIAPGHDNTGNSSITVNGVTNSIYLASGSQLPAGALVGNQIAFLLYSSNLDGWVLMNSALTSYMTTSAQGTANEVLVNGTFGTAYSGALVLTTAQPIGTTSAPTFASLTLAAQANAINMNSHQINGVLDPSVSQDAATKNYVDNAIVGLTPQAAVEAASTVSLIVTYNNGSSGVGATLTNADTQTAFTIDGYVASLNDRILIKNQAGSTQNGIYTVTTLGNGSTNWVLTRAVNYDDPVSINNSGFVPVIQGTVNEGTGWVQTAIVVTIGTSPIVFVQFGQTAGIIPVTGGGTGLSGTTINQILYSSAMNVIAGLPTLNNGVLITSAGGVPSISTTLPSGLIIPGYQATITPAALTENNDTNVTMTLGGSPSTALLQAVSMTLGWTGQLSLTRGGSNASLVASDGGIIYSTSSAMAVLSGTATALQMLQSGANAAPSWSTTTWPVTSTINQILYSSSNNVVAGLTTGNNGVLVTSAGGVPGISTTLPSGLIIPGYQETITPAALTESNDTNVTYNFGRNSFNLFTSSRINDSWMDWTIKPNTRRYRS